MNINLLIISGVALGAALLIIWIIDILRNRTCRPQVTWGHCWFCPNMLGDDSALAKIYAHCYVPICKQCAANKKYRKYVLTHREESHA